MGGTNGHPRQLREGDRTNFRSSNWPKAKEQLGWLLEQLSWRKENILDLGGFSTARGTELYVALWMRLRLFEGINSHTFNLNVITS